MVRVVALGIGSHLSGLEHSTTATSTVVGATRRKKRPAIDHGEAPRLLEAAGLLRI